MLPILRGHWAITCFRCEAGQWCRILVVLDNIDPSNPAEVLWGWAKATCGVAWPASPNRQRCFLATYGVTARPNNGQNWRKR
jgi:hypothetical protein